MSVTPLDQRLRGLGQSGAHRSSARACRLEPNWKFDASFQDAASPIIVDAGPILDAQRRIGNRCDGIDNAAREHAAKSWADASPAIADHADIELVPDPIRLRAVGDESIDRLV